VSVYIQYHNCDKEGLLVGDSRNDLGIHTRLSHVQEAVGGRVFLILGIGKPRRFYLWNTFRVKSVRSFTDGDGKIAYHAIGPGFYLAPPHRLEGPEFDAFKKSCANFVGFRKVDDLPYSNTLKLLAHEHQPPGSPAAIERFVAELCKMLGAADRKKLADYFGGLAAPSPKPTTNKSEHSVDGAKPGIRALSIRQPHAEAIMRGVKKIEYRSGPTRIRGRILIYASLGRYSAADEGEMMKDYGIKDVACADLPRGVLIGSVELFDCDDGDWHVRKPERAEKLVKPKKQPQPVWFYPF
jgi:hypothetical protein